MIYNLQLATQPADSYTTVAVCGLVSPEFNPDLFVMVQNQRGWDLPGGRLEPDEAPLAAFERELYEETGLILQDRAQQIAYLALTDQPGLGVAVYRGVGKGNIHAFKPTTEILAVAEVTQQELLARYYGDKDLIRQAISLITA